MNDTSSAIILKLKKATSELLLLHLLNEKDMYGYQLASEIKKRSQGVCTFKETSMYPILNRLMEQGLITTRNVITEKKKVRAYYHLEDSGKQYYAEMKADYDIYIDAINQLLTIEVEIHADQKND